MAERVEGNLLAAAQEIEKIVLLYPPGVLTVDQLLSAISDSARFDVFKLMDAALEGKVGRSLRILSGLKAEGVAEPIVLWAVTREIRLLADIAKAVAQGQAIGSVFAKRRDIWEKRRPIISQAIKRQPLDHWPRLLQSCAEADRAIKGRSASSPWLIFQDLLMSIAHGIH